MNGHGLLNQLGDEPPARLTETIVKVPIPQSELPAKTAEDRHAATLRQDLATLTSVLEDERNPQAAADRKEAARLAALPAWSPSKTRVEEKDATPEKETTPEDEEPGRGPRLFWQFTGERGTGAPVDPGAAGRGHDAGDGGGVVHG